MEGNFTHVLWTPEYVKNQETFDAYLKDVGVDNLIITQINESK